MNAIIQRMKNEREKESKGRGETCQKEITRLGLGADLTAQSYKWPLLCFIKPTSSSLLSVRLGTFTKKHAYVQLHAHLYL